MKQWPSLSQGWRGGWMGRWRKRMRKKGRNINGEVILPRQGPGRAGCSAWTPSLRQSCKQQWQWGFGPISPTTNCNHTPVLVPVLIEPGVGVPLWLDVLTCLWRRRRHTHTCWSHGWGWGWWSLPCWNRSQNWRSCNRRSLSQRPIRTPSFQLVEQWVLWTPGMWGQGRETSYWDLLRRGQGGPLYTLEDTCPGGATMPLLMIDCNIWSRCTIWNSSLFTNWTSWKRQHVWEDLCLLCRSL